MSTLIICAIVIFGLSGAVYYRNRSDKAKELYRLEMYERERLAAVSSESVSKSTSPLYSGYKADVGLPENEYSSSDLDQDPEDPKQETQAKKSFKKAYHRESSYQQRLRELAYEKREKLEADVRHKKQIYDASVWKANHTAKVGQNRAHEIMDLHRKKADHVRAIDKTRRPK